mmetsp:Transcript_64218/g.114004  ORF Transcript_64218/g.114004 Transcript_64218/m.114004 type:complete len:628 (+) Transcript_64218:98-1981(+)
MALSPGGACKAIVSSALLACLLAVRVDIELGVRVGVNDQEQDLKPEISAADVWDKTDLMPEDPDAGEEKWLTKLRNSEDPGLLDWNAIKRETRMAMHMNKDEVRNRAWIMIWGHFVNWLRSPNLGKEEFEVDSIRDKAKLAKMQNQAWNMKRFEWGVCKMEVALALASVHDDSKSPFVKRAEKWMTVARGKEELAGGQSVMSQAAHAYLVDPMTRLGNSLRSSGGLAKLTERRCDPNLRYKCFTWPEYLKASGLDVSAAKERWPSLKEEHYYKFQARWNDLWELPQQPDKSNAADKSKYARTAYQLMFMQSFDRQLTNKDAWHILHVIPLWWSEAAWEVILDRTKGEKLGMENFKLFVDSNGNERGLQAMTISNEGLVPKWNAEVASTNPGQMVGSGDVIVDVNGKRKKAEMETELGKNIKLDIWMSSKHQADEYKWKTHHELSPYLKWIFPHFLQHLHSWVQKKRDEYGNPDVSLKGPVCLYEVVPYTEQFNAVQKTTTLACEASWVNWIWKIGVSQHDTKLDYKDWLQRLGLAPIEGPKETGPAPEVTEQMLEELRNLPDINKIRPPLNFTAMAKPPAVADTSPDQPERKRGRREKATPGGPKVGTPEWRAAKGLPQSNSDFKPY